MRTCKDCNKEKPLEEFASAGIVKGVQYYRHRCVPCYSKFKSVRKDALKEYIWSIKQKSTCSRCGFDDWRALQFHHKEHKIANVSDMVRDGNSIEKLDEEISKCEIICANCHQIEHFGV
jgi:hypothetical protein